MVLSSSLVFLMEPLYNIQLSTQPQVHYYSKLLLLWSDTISTVQLYNSWSLLWVPRVPPESTVVIDIETQDYCRWWLVEEGWDVGCLVIVVWIVCIAGQVMR